MEFWSRLLAHTPLSSGSSRKDFSQDPARRLHRFEREYSQLLQTWRNSSDLARDEEAAENIESRLQELSTLLSDESRRPLPHPCIAFASNKQIYSTVAKIATTSYNEWIIKEAVLFFATLIESEEEAFVENDKFSASLTNLLVRITGANSIRLGADTEARVVELAFNITTKIRLEPDILPAWFKGRSQMDLVESEAGRDEHDRFTGRTQKQDFPLFYLLIDYIHHDGKVGDFARTGLLYIIEAASNSVALEQWIVESDLSTLMATGLGALYSQLSRKLVIDHPAHRLPAVLALSDYQHPKSNYEVVSSCTVEFMSHLDTFLSHLLFWQDVLNHCRSVEVKTTLLEHFQVIFLQQLLYPSLLESSDIDGGSSVAVLTYLRRILESVDHPDMVNLVLHYLLALPDVLPSLPPSAVASAPDSVSAARKRKSMDLATMMASEAKEAADPLLFNLVDLVLACLRSRNHQTVFVTLQLVSVILKRHHRYAVTTLLWTEAIRNESARRTSGAHLQEVDFLLSLAGAIGGRDNFDAVYDCVLQDTRLRLESHPCSMKLVAPHSSLHNHKLPVIPDSLPGAPRHVRFHTLKSDDPLLNIVLDRLLSFFLNPVETNLSLTETLVDLAACGFVALEGWFLRSPHSYSFDEDDDDVFAERGNKLDRPDDAELPEHTDFLKMQSIKRCRRRPKWTSCSLPRLLTILWTLADQVDAYRQTIPRFEHLLQQRREAFQTAESASLPPVSTHQTKTSGRESSPGLKTPSVARTDTEDSDASSLTPARPSGLEGFAQRILSELGTPSRSLSPRTRKDARPASSGHSSPASVPPREFPINLNTPPRPLGLGKGDSVGRPYSPASSEIESRASRDEAIEGQKKAFQAIDQSILARQVGTRAVKSNARQSSHIPISFTLKTIPDERTFAIKGDREDSPESTKRTAIVEAVDATGHGNDAVVEVVDAPSEAGNSDESSQGDEETASVSHILTNVLILQSFLFELASLVQVRAALFDEVRFA